MKPDYRWSLGVAVLERLVPYLRDDQIVAVVRVCIEMDAATRSVA